MRVCGDENDKGYAAFVEMGCQARVFLNGVEVNGAICDLADSDEGIIRVAVLNERGEFQIDEHEEIRKEIKRGTVEIRPY